MKTYYAYWILMESYQIGAISIKFGGMNKEKYVGNLLIIVSKDEKGFDPIAAFLLLYFSWDPADLQSEFHSEL